MNTFLTLAEADAGGGGAVIFWLLIFGVLCAICNTLGKKKSYDVSGTIRER